MIEIEASLGHSDLDVIDRVADLNRIGSIPSTEKSSTGARALKG